MTAHAGKKSGLAAASSVTGTTPVPGKNTGFSPTPYGAFSNGSNNQDLPPPFLFVDSLKPIEIVVSFTAFTKWLDPPQSVIKEKEKEKEKDLLSSGNGKKLQYCSSNWSTLVQKVSKKRFVNVMSWLSWAMMLNTYCVNRIDLEKRSRQQKSKKERRETFW